jgi:cell shape-determining protein MreC
VNLVFEIFWTVLIIYWVGWIVGLWQSLLGAFEHIVRALKGNPQSEERLQAEVRRLEKRQKELTQQLVDERNKTRLVIEGKPHSTTDEQDWGTPK